MTERTNQKNRPAFVWLKCSKNINRLCPTALKRPTSVTETACFYFSLVLIVASLRCKRRNEIGTLGNVKNCQKGNPEAVAILTKERLLAKPGGKDIGLTLPMQRVINARFALRSREHRLIVSSSFDGLYRL
jgi:hypothetical protein